MDKQTIVTAIIAALGTLGGIWGGKRIEKAKAKKISAEADSLHMETTEKAVAIWEDLNKQLHHEVEVLRVQVRELIHENKQLHIEVNRLNSEVTRLNKFIK